MHFRNVLHQHPTRGHASKGFLRVGHAHQQHVGLAGVGVHLRQLGQSFKNKSTLPTNIKGLKLKNLLMFKRKQGCFTVQHADVVGRAHLVNFCHQGRATHQVAQADTGQAKLAQGTQQQHVVVTWQAIQVALASKRLVGLVNHHQTALLAGRVDDALDGCIVPQVGTGVVRVGQVGDGRAVLRHGRQHGRKVQLKVCGERHADKIKPLQLRAHGVHHKTRLRGQHHGIFKAIGGTGRHGTGQRQQADELV